VITLEEVLQLHYNSIRDFGGSSGIRDINLLESSIIRPYQSFENVELYPSAYAKAAAILHSIVKNHPFVDGNKRTGFLAAFALLYRAGIELTASEENAYDFVINVASSSVSFAEIVVWFSENTKIIAENNE